MKKEIIGGVEVYFTGDSITINNITFTLQELKDLDHTLSYTKVKLCLAEAPRELFKYIENMGNREEIS